MNEQATPVPNWCLAPARQNECPKCGSKNLELRNYSMIWHDGDIHCADCDTYVRSFDAD